MMPDPDDSAPDHCEPSKAPQNAEFSPFDSHSEVDSIVVNASVELVYAHCSCLGQLPRFITSLCEVEEIDDTHFSLTPMLAGERKIVLQILLRVPERRIVWQSTSQGFLRGVVLFEPLSDQETKMTVKMRSNLDKQDLVKVTREYLTNFKRVVEQEPMP